MIEGYSKNDEGLIVFTFKKISKGFIRQRPFCTGLSSGNQVDGLPLGLHFDKNMMLLRVYTREVGWE